MLSYLEAQWAGECTSKRCNVQFGFPDVGKMLYFKLTHHLVSDIKSFKIDKFQPRHEMPQKCACLEVERNFWKDFYTSLVLKHFPELCLILGKLALPGRYSRSEEIVRLQKCCLAVSPRLTLQQKVMEEKVAAASWDSGTLQEAAETLLKGTKAPVSPLRPRL